MEEPVSLGSYAGTPLEEMSEEHLRDAVVNLARLLEESRATHSHTLDMWTAFQKRR